MNELDLHSRMLMEERSMERRNKIIASRIISDIENSQHLDIEERLEMVDKNLKLYLFDLSDFIPKNKVIAMLKRLNYSDDGIKSLISQSTQIDQ